MAFKNYVPTSQVHWEEYWNRTNIENNLADCDTDGLLPILDKYLPKKGKILEAGCGLGKWVIYLSRKGYDILGIDSYKGAVDLLKKYDNKLQVEVGSVEKLKQKSGSMAVYLSFGVVEHFEEGPEKPLSEAFRVLKKDGIVIIETPCDTPVRQLVRLIEGLKVGIKTPARIFMEGLKLRPKKVAPNKYFYEYQYTPEELKNYVARAGFKILEVLPKDDLADNRSIGLWLDFPVLRDKKAPNFHLNLLGRLVKKVLLPFPSLWSCCVVVVARKE